jgi:flagellar assembly protein FliH
LERESLQQAEWATGGGAGGCIEIFEYPADPNTPRLADWDSWTAAAESKPGAPVKESPSSISEVKVRAEFDQRLNEETRKAFEAGRARGRQEGQQAEREAQAGAQAAVENKRTQQAREWMESFAQERDRYLHAVEREVVELALAVAARILRRESQMDPLLLTGAVRVALGQLAGSTQVRLRVPQEELELWTEAMALLPNLALKPTVVAGEGMRVGECAIETELGSVDLGIRAQLGEIERGFFDRAGGRRGETARTADVNDNAGREKRA